MEQCGCFQHPEKSAVKKIVIIHKGGGGLFYWVHSVYMYTATWKGKGKCVVSFGEESGVNNYKSMFQVVEVFIT